MVDPSSVCQHCGAARKPAVRFCGQCGKAAEADQPAAAPAPAPVPASAPSKKTMMGFQSPLGGASPPVPTATSAEAARAPVAHFQPAPGGPRPAADDPAPAPVAAAQSIGKGKTMLGLSAAMVPSPSPAVASAPAAATPRFTPGSTGPAYSGSGSSPDAPAAAADVGNAKTMLGISAATAPTTPARGHTPVFTPPAGAAAFAQTMLGDGPAASGTAAAPAPAHAPAAAVAPASTGKVAAGRTMLGVSSAAVSQPAPAAKSAPSRAAAPQGRTMLGVTPGMVPSAGADPTPMDTNAPSFSQTGGAYYDDEPVAVVPKRGGGTGVAVGLLLLVAAGAAAAFFMFGREHVSKVQARVVAADSGDEAMQFEVAGAVAGAKIRFGGQERALEAGRVIFPLAKDSLRVGDNVVLVDLLEPGGDVTSERITLAVDFRIRSDTSPLETDPPAIDVVVSALAGSTVTLDGEPLKLDAAGKGVKRYPIDVATQSNAGVIDHAVKYRVQPPAGEASVGELVTKIPLSTLQIDRPGITVVTDKAEVEIAGAVAPGGKLTIDGVAVEVNAGRFLHRMALPTPQAYAPRIVASEPGKAPYGVSLNIRRVLDLAQEALSFVVDPSLTYARISQNTSIYKGQNAAFEGRVYNVTVQGGRSVIQMLARDCPDGGRCSLWVTYPAATDATVNSWIRVLGTLDGEQQFRSESNEVKTVPKVEATYILPAAP